MDSRDQLPYTDCPPTRLRAVRIRRKSQQKTNTNLSHNRANFRIENQKRKESENQELDENSKSTLECLYSSFVLFNFILILGALRMNTFLRTTEIKSYSGLRSLVYKSTHSKNLTRGLRPIELLGCKNTKNKIK